MDHIANRYPSNRGYSLIELLVVLAIVGILAIVGLSNFAPKSPKATRATLIDLRNGIQSARQTAISSGKTVRIRLESTGGQWRFKIMDVFLVETNVAATLFSDTLPSKSMSYCTLAANKAALPTTSTKVTDLTPASSYGFGDSAVGWNNCLAGAITYGFSPSGTVVQLTGASPNPSVSPLGGGFWVGVLGNSPNTKGIPYGVVLVTQQGQVVTYYKGDSQLDDTTEHKWMRLE